MTIDEAFELVANLDVREPLRRFAPQHGLLVFNRFGEVVGVYRFKTRPTELDHINTLARHPGCVQIQTMPHWHASSDELKKRICDGYKLFSQMKPLD